MIVCFYPNGGKQAKNIKALLDYDGFDYVHDEVIIVKFPVNDYGFHCASRLMIIADYYNVGDDIPADYDKQIMKL